MEDSKSKHWSHLTPREFNSMNSQEYIVERINQYREWYDKKANSAKNKYLYMRTISVLSGAIVPVLINMSSDEWMKYVTSVLSLLVVILISLESVYHYREQWKNYRSCEQYIAKEYFNFCTGEGPYRKMQKGDAFLMLVERVETAIESENASTLNVMTTVAEHKSGGNNGTTNGSE
jgi:hypothetical protein